MRFRLASGFRRCFFFSFREGVSRDRAVEFCPADDMKRSCMELFGSGVKVTVNTGLAPDTELRTVWKELIGKHALMPREMKAALLNAADAAFADESTRASLRARIEAAFQPVGNADDPWTLGTDLTAWIEDGTLHIAGPGEICSTPWTARAGEIAAIETDARATGFTAAMLAAMPNVKTVNGLTREAFTSAALGFVKAMGFSAIAVDPTTQKAMLDVVVWRSDSLGESAEWKPVSTNEVTVPALGEQGFFIVSPQVP